MKYIKTYENIKNGWIINIDDIVNPTLLQSDNLKDIRNKDGDYIFDEDEYPGEGWNIKIGDIVIAVWFTGGFNSYLLKTEYVNGTYDNDTFYDLEHAWGVFDYEEYIKLDPEFEIKLSSKKYNL